MHISKYNDYLIANRPGVNIVISGDKLKDSLNENTVSISRIHTYEIYTKNPNNLNEGGWDIKLVRSTDELIKQFPLFDVIITKNDVHVSECEDFLNFWTK